LYLILLIFSSNDLTIKSIFSTLKLKDSTEYEAQISCKYLYNSFKSSFLISKLLNNKEVKSKDNNIFSSSLMLFTKDEVR